MTRVEFTSICVAGGLLLLGYGADAVAHWYGQAPSSRYAREDSIFFALAARMGSAGMDTTDTGHVAATATDSSGHEEQPGPNRPLALDLNTATRAQLVKLPGIGPALADRIVRSREVEGPFKSVEDLQRVSGIGPSKASRIASMVTVRPPADSR